MDEAFEGSIDGLDCQPHGDRATDVRSPSGPGQD